jgi:hypothetical protein
MQSFWLGRQGKKRRWNPVAAVFPLIWENQIWDKNNKTGKCEVIKKSRNNKGISTIKSSPSALFSFFNVVAEFIAQTTTAALLH